MGWTIWEGSSVRTPEGFLPFSPSTKIADAFLLVDEVLKECRGQFRLKRGPSRFTTTLFFGKHSSQEFEYGHGTQLTEPLAICQAAMMAMDGHRKLIAELAMLDLTESIYEEGM